jgi:hypothetical protein
MSSFFAKVVSPPGLRTIGACVGLEALVLALLYYLTRSLAGSIIISIVALGPLSLFIALPLYRHFSRAK